MFEDIISQVVGGIIGAGVFGTLFAFVFARWQAKQEAKELAKKNANMETRAIEAYTQAVNNLNTNVAVLKATNQWNEETEKETSAKAIENAECVMTVDLLEWINAQFANPQRWKETLIDNLVQKLKC